MEPNKISPDWPNALRWFLKQNLHSFTPWHLIQDPLELAAIARVFQKEDVSRGAVFVFACRQDRDDFAGIEIVDGKYTDRVLYFHPVFSSRPTSDRTWNIVNDVFDDVFDFVAKQVIPDMRDWAADEDASDI